MAANIITLTTDFGTADIYAGTMKGVMLSINPGCTIIDITHEIPARDIMGACFALSTCYCYFPAGTIHVAVVDPGVGSLRRPILVETDKYIFVGPDNGIFSFALSGEGLKNVFELTNASYFLSAPSTTFHGRDIFAPVAAHLSKGVLPECFGSRLCDPVVLQPFQPSAGGRAEVEGEIIHVDRFGNLITNLSFEIVKDLIESCVFSAEIKGRTISQLLPNYASAADDEIFCVLGSSGYLEVSVKNKSAAEALGAQKGERIRVSGRER